MQTLLTMIYPKCYRKTTFSRSTVRTDLLTPYSTDSEARGKRVLTSAAHANKTLVTSWQVSSKCLCTRSGKRATQRHGSRKLTPHKSFSLLFLSSLDFPYNISGIFWPKCGSSWNLTVNIPESTVLTQLLLPSLPFLGPTCHSWAL